MSSSEGDHFDVSPIVANRIRLVLEQQSNDMNDDNGGNCGAQAFCRTIIPITQDGPQCGLVSALMAANTIRLSNDKNVNQLQELAQQKGYTNRGEMFSANWLAELIHILWPTIHCSVSDLPSKNALVSLIASGSLLLVPYDCDKNNEPAMLNGHYAHWCVIGGYLSPNKALNEIVWGRTVPAVTDVLYVFALHGKSRHFAVWDYDCLVASNANLFEFSKKKSGDGHTYVLPQEGLEGLRCKCLIMSGH